MDFLWANLSSWFPFGVGVSEKFLIKALQILQNKAARSVTRLGIFTPVKTLLKQCGWLSVHQLVFFHTVVLLFKISKMNLQIICTVGQELTTITKQETRIPESLYWQFQKKNFTFLFPDFWGVRGGLIGIKNPFFCMIDYFRSARGNLLWFRIYIVGLGQ